MEGVSRDAVRIRMFACDDNQWRFHLKSTRRSSFKELKAIWV